MATPTLCVHFSPSDNYITGFDFDIYFSQVKVGLVKGKFEVIEEIRKPGHPPVLHQVHRPQDEVDSLAILIPGPQKEYTEY